MRTRITIGGTPDGRRVLVSRLVDASPERVWRILVDTRRWSEWGPSVREVRSPDRLVRDGSRGRIRTIGGVWLPFEVGSDGTRRWTWRVAGVPATGHEVEPVGDGSRVTFEVPLLAAPYAVVCWVALRRLDAIATSA